MKEGLSIHIDFGNSVFEEHGNDFYYHLLKIRSFISSANII